MSFITHKFRVKEATVGKHLDRHAIACNQVWNFLVGHQQDTQRAWMRGAKVKWATAFDLIRLCTGDGAKLGLHSDTVMRICQQFVASRDLHKKCPRFRSSFGARRSLGWVPFISRAIKIDGDTAVYLKRRFRFWKSRDIEGVFKTGAFVQDARGRWYLTLICEVADDIPCGIGEVGIDLGLKEFATTSNGDKIAAPKFYRREEATLARAQRSRNKKRVRSIHAKIANRRRHFLHVASTKLADQNSLIVVGNVNAAGLAKTRMAKSVLDAGWSAFRQMLSYKSARRQSVFVEASERFTSQACSCCGAIPPSSPKGMAALGIRHWQCSDCGASHDRDVNAARNILRVGLERQAPQWESPSLPGGEDVKPHPPCFSPNILTHSPDPH